MKLTKLAICLSAAIAAAPASAEHFNFQNHTDVIKKGIVVLGERLFDTPFIGTNGRACGTCHVKEDHRALTPEHVQALYEQDPENVLFMDIDADVMGTDNPTFENLKHGLVRIVLPLPDNMDVIDLFGNVITNEERTIEVWRSVPSIENTALSAPFLADGRAETLEEQAIGAIEAHSENRYPIPPSALHLIAAYEESEFSSDRARQVAEQLEAGVPLDEIENPDYAPEYVASLTDAQARGQEVYVKACTQCHGKATDNQLERPDVLQSLCWMPKPDGNLDLTFEDLNGNDFFDPFEIVSLTAAAPDEPCDPRFMNIGTGITTTLGKLGLFNSFNKDLALPQYRFRFYTDGTRSEQVTDLPPIPSLNPDGTPATDERGVPIAGPGGIPQLFTTDPGRAAITGKPQDYEAFAIPQLRGIANTAPYFHDNVVGTLEEVVDLYSQAIIPFTPLLGLPPIHPTSNPRFFPTESLSAQEKADLVEFLKVF